MPRVNTTQAPPHDYHDGWHEERVIEPARRNLRSWTALCAHPESPRGQYDEEVDVRARNATAARRIAEDVLAEENEPGMTVRRLVERFGWFL